MEKEIVCLSQSLYCFDETPSPKASWGGKDLDLFGSTLPHDNLSLKENRSGTGTGQEPGWRQKLKRPWRGLLPGLLNMACSVASFIEQRTTNPGVPPPTVGWLLPPLITNKENAFLLDLSGGIFSSEIPSFHILQLVSSWHKVATT